MRIVRIARAWAFGCLLLASSTSGVAAERPHELTQDIERFLEQLTLLRQGDDSVLDRLRAISRHLCREHARCDAGEVVEYYASLSVQERVLGLKHEQEFLEVRRYAVQAGTEGLPEGEAWKDLRADLISELGAFVLRIGEHGDVTPAARGLALLARLEIEIAADRELAPEERQGALDSSARHAEEAIRLFEVAGQLTPQLEPLWVLGRIARTRGKPSEARAFFQRCLSLAERARRDDWRETSLFGLVNLVRDAGDVAAVERLLSEIATFRSPRESWPLACYHANRLLHDDRPETALAFLQAHAPTAAAHEDDWHALLAAALLRSGQLRAARREIEHLASKQGELAALATASVDLAEGFSERVLDALGEDPGASASSRTAGWSPQSRAQAAALVGEAWLADGRPDRALGALEHALDLAGAWASLRDDETPGSVIGEWIGLHAVTLLARAHAALGHALEALRILEEYQSRGLRQGRGRALDADDLSAWAGAYEGGLISYAVGPDQGLLAHLSPGLSADSADAWVEPMPLGRRAFERAVRRLREAAIAGNEDRIRELSSELSEVLFPAALLSRLETVPVGGRLLLLLHGPLESLPVGLLEVDGVPLDERFTPLVLPGLPEARPGPAPGPDVFTNWTLLGSPRADDARSTVRLPGASRELARLERLYPRARVFSGSAFVRDALFDALDQDRCLHLATHLVTNAGCSQLRLSALALEMSNDQLVCAEEILQRAPRLPLVVLTACETAGGRFVDAEGLHGLGRAFLQPGTRNLLATLWPVEDEAALRFALLFHENLSGGALPSRAAAAARRTMRENGAPAADWAAFRLLGRD